MCTLIEIDGVICDSRAQLEKALGGPALTTWEGADWPADCCLCPCAVEDTANRYGYKLDLSDPFVTVFKRTAGRGSEVQP